jgi:type I restriction enzyme M protein
MTQNIQQLREEFKQKIDILNNYLFAQGLSDPMTRIQQLSFFFFLKMLEEQDIAKEKEEKITGHKHRSLFEGKKEKFRWSQWRVKVGGNLYKFVRDEIFPFIEELHNGHSNISQIFHGAKLLIPDEATLKRVVEIIDTIEFSSLDTDVKGDLYEYLLSQISSAGKLGAFLTPRHIIRAIVEMVNPKIGETVFDPACGTGGFLITAYDYIKFKNSDPKNIEEKNGRRVGYGDKLNKEQWQFLTQKTFTGYDVAPEVSRLALMNLLLHGLEGARILRKDTVAGSEDENDLKRYEVILTNPPFAGLVDAGRIKPTLPVKSKKTQVLFLGYVINSLKPGGRAGIILPEGSLFGTNKDDKDIRRYLLENAKLEAVVSMPAGVFQPYAGVKTSFLIFKKRPKPIALPSVIASEAKQSHSSVIPAKAGTQSLDEQIWFFDMRGDGSSLSAAKKFGPQYKNDVPKLLALWTERKVEKPYSWLTSVKEIAENDYILSANTYSPYNGEEEANHRDPKEILKEIEDDEKKLQKTLNMVQKLL